MNASHLILIRKPSTKLYKGAHRNCHRYVELFLEIEIGKEAMQVIAAAVYIASWSILCPYHHIASGQKITSRAIRIAMPSYHFTATVI